MPQTEEAVAHVEELSPPDPTEERLKALENRVCLLGSEYGDLLKAYRDTRKETDHAVATASQIAQGQLESKAKALEIRLERVTNTNTEKVNNCISSIGTIMSTRLDKAVLDCARISRESRDLIDERMAGIVKQNNEAFATASRAMSEVKSWKGKFDLMDKKINDLDIRTTNGLASIQPLVDNAVENRIGALDAAVKKQLEFLARKGGEKKNQQI